MNQALQYLRDQSITIEEAAQKTGYAVNTIYALLNGHNGISGEAYSRLTNAIPGIEPLLRQPPLLRRINKRLSYLVKTVETLRNSPTDACVEWPFACAPGDGYGRVWNGIKLVTVHRMAYELYYKVEVSLYILHQCDNPKCFNPAHLYEGTQAQNGKDRHDRGPSKFTEDIRARRKEYNHRPRKAKR